MANDPKARRGEVDPERPGTVERSDLKVVLQFFIVPLALVAVLVGVFFGLQVLRGYRPDPESSLQALRRRDGFFIPWVGDPKRWQSGYDLSLRLRTGDRQEVARLTPELSSAFREAGARDDRALRRYLALVLGRAGDARGLEALRDGMRDPDPQTRLFSTWGIMNLGDRSALPDLRSALTDEDPGVRKIAAYALGRFEDPASARSLAAALRDDVSDVRWNAALALARIGDRRGAPELIALLERSLSADGQGDATGSGRDELALNAIRGLALLQVEEARSTLGRAASSAPQPALREAARLALKSYPGDSRKTLP